uniref:MYND-type domain-containing protein n=1 Tax=Anopheles merus TaxID=30066 RepID=A0A182UWR5_ANOME
MSLMPGDSNFDLVQYFLQLWEMWFEPRISEATQARPEMAEAIIRREIEDYLRTSLLRERLQLQPDTKDNAKALAARNRGNELFVPKLGKDLEALQHYNESIAYSEPGSEARALAYGDRSVVCLKFNLFKECLENIRLARASNYPARLANQLSEREQYAKKCLNQLPPIFPDPARRTPGKYRPRDTGRPALQLSYEAHRNIPHLVKCVELRQNSEFGRHLVTTQHLKAGDVLMIEKPYASLLCERDQYKRCAFCHNEDTFTLIPCEGCTVAMYCSEECRDKAHKQYHRYECAVLRDCWRVVGFPVEMLLGLRTVATAFASFDQSLGQWIYRMDTLDETKVNAFTVDWNKATVRDFYDTVHVLATNQNRRDHKQLASLIFFAYFVQGLLLDRTELGPLCRPCSSRRKLLFELLLRHTQTALTSKNDVYHMECVKLEDDRVEEDESEDDSSDDNNNSDDRKSPRNVHHEERTHAIAIYPLFSMVNHSCIPNVAPIHLLDGRLAMVATRPIAAGEQLYNSNGFSTFDPDHSARRHALQLSHFFKCRCASCQSRVVGFSRVKLLEEQFFFRRLSLKDWDWQQEVHMLVDYMNQAERGHLQSVITGTELLLAHTMRKLYGYAPDDDMFTLTGELSKKSWETTVQQMMRFFCG